MKVTDQVMEILENCPKAKIIQEVYTRKYKELNLSKEEIAAFDILKINRMLQENKEAMNLMAKNAYNYYKNK